MTKTKLVKTWTAPDGERYSARGILRSMTDYDGRYSARFGELELTIAASRIVIVDPTGARPTIAVVMSSSAAEAFARVRIEWARGRS